MDKHLMEAALLCEHCMKEESPVAFQKFKMLCRMLGHRTSRLVHLVAPDQFVMSNAGYEGGSLELVKTISTFCTRGRSVENVVSRKRTRDARKVELLVVYDDSNSMTGWWRSEYLKRRIHESNSPQTLAKIACISLLETFGKNASVSLVFYGSKAEGPLTMRHISYRELVRRDGSGGTRLDEGLRIAYEKKWHKRGGQKFIVILTDGVPEGGNENLEEDRYIQSKSIFYIDTFLEFGAKILFVPILTDVKLAYKTYGGYNAYTFSKVLEKKKGLTVKVTEKLEVLVENLFTGVKEMVS